MCQLRAILFGMVAFFYGNSVYADTEWFYSNLSEPTSRQVVLSPQYIGGHFQVEAKTCENDSPFLCYESQGFNFAIPKTLNGQRKWTLNGSTYEIVKETRFKLLGKEISVMWIDQALGKKGIRFLYSETRGLIGFASRMPKGPLFLLENACGFGASSDCVE